MASRVVVHKNYPVCTAESRIIPCDEAGCDRQGGFWRFRASGKPREPKDALILLWEAWSSPRVNLGSGILEGSRKRALERAWAQNCSSKRVTGARCSGRRVGTLGRVVRAGCTGKTTGPGTPAQRRVFCHFYATFAQNDQNVTFTPFCARRPE